jgi:TPR repeat protein
MRNPLTVGVMVAVAVSLGQATASAPAGRALYLEGIVWQGGGGRNSPIDLPRAEKLLRQAAALGDAEAMDRLGDMYRDGEGGLSVDLAEARGWYEKEGAAGGAWGYYSLAEFYREGHGVEKDAEKAAELGKKAFALAKERAEAGDLAAMDALAWCYLRGVGTEENEAEGMKWLKKAAEAEYPPSLLGLAWMGSRVNNEPEQSLDLLMKAADKGIATAAEQAGVWYIEGVGMDPLPLEGLKWMNRAAAMGRSRTYGEIGRLYLRGQGVEKDLKKAVEFFEKGAAKGDAGAMRELAACYEDAAGVEQDYGVAAKWYRKAAEQGDGESMYELAKLYELGTGVPADAGEARKWYEKAAGAGVVAAREWVEAVGK